MNIDDCIPGIQMQFASTSTSRNEPRNVIYNNVAFLQV